MESPLSRPIPRLELFEPPYQAFRKIDTSWTPKTFPPRGEALIWRLADAASQAKELEWLYSRPPGLPLIVVMPPPRFLEFVMPLLRYVQGARPKAILPTCEYITPERLVRLLAAAPRDLASTVAKYLEDRGLLRTKKIYDEVKCVLELAPQTHSIARLSRRLSLSRRTLGRHYLSEGIPVPSHWLQFSRLLYVSVRLQNEDVPISRLLGSTGYPDVFTMSNQMKRLIGCRPSDVRHCVGWEWIVEAWIAREARAGRFDPERHSEAVRPYLVQDASDATVRDAQDEDGEEGAVLQT